MIYSNARLQTDNMFAALLILIFMTITIYKITDYVLRDMYGGNKIY